jgi:dienelactone hydrolase
MIRLLLIALSALAFACTSGPGRAPDATPEPEDAGAVDRGVVVTADAEVVRLDAGFVVATIADAAGRDAVAAPDAAPDATTSDAGASPDAAGGADAAPGTYSFQVVGQQAVTVNQMQATLEQVRATRSDGRRAYLSFLAAPQPGARPAVVITDPYGGQSWTQEQAEQAWARPTASPYSNFWVDQSCPETPAGAILYGAPQAAQAVAETLAVHHLNGVSSVIAHGRFYACDAAEGDVEDTVAALTYLAARGPTIDVARVGVAGASWGGFMALWGAAASPIVRPIVVSALYPPSDLPTTATYGRQLATSYPYPEDLWFWTPYERRIARSPSAPALTHATLCTALPADVTIYHDVWDVLVPVTQTQGLAAACAQKVRPVYWRRPAPIDYARVRLAHGLMDSEAGQGYSAALTLALTHVHLAITAPTDTIYEALDPLYLAQLLSLSRAAAQRGESTRDVAAAIADLAAARVQLYDLRGQRFYAGSEAVATLVNQVYGTNIPASQIEAQLRTQGLP